MFLGKIFRDDKDKLRERVQSVFQWDHLVAEMLQRFGRARISKKTKGRKNLERFENEQGLSSSSSPGMQKQCLPI